jgi:hypothetical protein
MPGHSHTLASLHLVEDAEEVGFGF